MTRSGALINLFLQHAQVYTNSNDHGSIFQQNVVQSQPVRDQKTLETNIMHVDSGSWESHKNKINQ
jgi:hypothetical protein